MDSGKVYTVYIEKREEPIEGVFLSENDYWMKLLWIPVDYVIDGVVYIKKKHVSDVFHLEDEEFKTKVIQRKVNIDLFSKLPTHTKASELLLDLRLDEKTILFDEKDDTVFFLGKIDSVSDVSFVIKRLSIRGKWLSPEAFNINDIRSLYIDTDYIISLTAMA